MRQTLSYFLPVYAYSRAENQQRMQKVAVDALHQLFNVHEGREDEDDESEMVSLSTIGAHLVDWTDPRKCYGAGAGVGDGLSLTDEGTSKKAINGDVHLDLARDILERLNGTASKEEKKILAPLLGKVYVSPASSEQKLRELYEEVQMAVDEKLVSDATGRNALLKIHVALGKIVNVLNAGDKQGLMGLGRKSRNVTPVDTPVESPMVLEKTVLRGQEEEEEAEEDEKTLMSASPIVPRSRKSTSKAVKRGGKKVVEEEDEKDELSKEMEDEDEQTIMTTRSAKRPPRVQRPRDSLVDELLSDDDEDDDEDESDEF